MEFSKQVNMVCDNNRKANQDFCYKKKSDAIKKGSEWQGSLIYCPCLACGQAGSKEDSSKWALRRAEK